MKFLRWVLNLFGFVVVTKDDNDKREARVKYLVEHNDFMKTCYHNLVDEYNVLRASYDKIEGTTLEEQKTRNDELQARQDKLSAQLEKSEEYYKTVQETINKWASGDLMFGFRNNPAFPGSSCVSAVGFTDSSISSKSDSDKFISICGRTVFTDEATEELRKYPDMGTKYWCAINYLAKYHLTDKIMDYIIKSGSLQMTLAYNTDCTAAELYYNLQVLKPNDSFLFDVEVEK